MTEHRFKIRWGALGCPTTPGEYNYEGRLIRVQQWQIDAADNNADAVFTVICSTPLSGPETCVLGAIDRPD
jgi:hypothetical protein